MLTVVNTKLQELSLRQGVILKFSLFTLLTGLGSPVSVIVLDGKVESIRD